MIRPIVLYGNPILRTRCQLVKTVDGEIETLAGDMIETMVDANGIGLAAPQVGVDMQLAVVDIRGLDEDVDYFRVDGVDAEIDQWMPLIFCNPEIEGSDPTEKRVEGCLSFPEIQGEILRPSAIEAQLTLLDGRQIKVETNGLLARAIQHETDHLHGILFIDRMSRVRKMTLQKELRKLQKEA